MIKLWFFSFVNLSDVSLNLRPAGRILKRGGKFFPSNSGFRIVTLPLLGKQRYHLADTWLLVPFVLHPLLISELLRHVVPYPLRTWALSYSFIVIQFCEGLRCILTSSDCLTNYLQICIYYGLPFVLWKLRRLSRKYVNSFWGTEMTYLNRYLRFVSCLLLCWLVPGAESEIKPEPVAFITTY